MSKTLTTEDSLAVFRTTFYSAMGVKAAEILPTDVECIKWFHAVIAQAEHRSDPPVVLIVQPGQVVQPPAGSALQTPVIVQRMDVTIGLPEWREGVK